MSGMEKLFQINSDNITEKFKSFRYNKNTK